MIHIDPKPMRCLTFEPHQHVPPSPLGAIRLQNALVDYVNLERREVGAEGPGPTVPSAIDTEQAKLPIDARPTCRASRHLR
jgi:hypothetical protein